MEDTFFSILDDKIETYRNRTILIKEASKNPDDEDNIMDDTEKANDVVESENQEAQADNVPDPTVMSQGEEGQGEELPKNDNGITISDSKLTMYANLLLKAFMAPPKNDIPSDLLNVTEENADKVINYIEKAIKVQKPQEELVNNLTKF